MNQTSEDSLILYEATGYTRWDEAYGINDDDIHEGDVMSTGSETSTSCYSGSDDRESCSDSTGDYDVPDGQLLINSREVSLEREASKSWEMKPLLTDNDDESEDEITHKPISAKEVIEHNKLFGYKTADYWWVHDDKVYSDYFVAYLRPMTSEEMKESTKEKVRDLKRELANTASLTETLEEFEKVLCRFEIKLNRQPSISGGDPNLLPFPTPHDFIPTDMRKWLCNWKPFIFEIELKSPDEPIYGSDPTEIDRYKLRPWLNNWEPFDTCIDGECAWECVKPDLFANDILTEEQRQTLDNRARRTKFHNEEKMALRRRKLMDYFRKTYHKSDDDLEKYSNFIQSHEENDKRLLSLC